MNIIDKVFKPFFNPYFKISYGNYRCYDFACESVNNNYNCHSRY